MENFENIHGKKLFYPILIEKKQYYLKLFFLKFFFRILKNYNLILLRLMFIPNQSKKPRTPLSGGMKNENKKKTEFKKSLIRKTKYRQKKVWINVKSRWKKDQFFKQLLMGLFSPIFFPKLKSNRRKGPSVFTDMNSKKFFYQDKETLYYPKRSQTFFGKYIPSNFKKSIMLKKKQLPLVKNDISEIGRKIKASKGLLNFSVILKILNNLIFKYGLKGFTPKTLEILVYRSNEFFKCLLFNLGQISLDRQKKKKKIFQRMGYTKRSRKKKIARQVYWRKKLNLKMKLKIPFFLSRGKKRRKI
mmetsp:Transcript_45982/g.107884  ORF Transcript_45982/g.107884 Transcript_45982/m.107884 type:complete len:302 (+) Transcript_45982:28-933(+)